MSEASEDTTEEPIDLSGLATQRHDNPDAYEFGRFSFCPQRQVLSSGSSEIRLGNRASVILTLLIERAREVVTKEEIFNAAWPSAGVEEVNLRVQIATIRKALNDSPENPEFITNVAGRGYLFLKAVEPRRSTHPGAPARTGRHPNSRGGLPAPLGKLVGRKDAVEGVGALIQQNRLVTVVGPGGVGKTSVALAAAHHMAPAFDDGMFFVDLASVADERQLLSVVARSLGITADERDPIGNLIEHLQGRQLLMVLDNCEHVIDPAAHLTERLLRAVPDLRILATSHEPLRAEAEWLFRLPPLELPLDRMVTLQDALGYSAISLFVDRANANGRGGVLSDADAPLIVDICRTLDGIPLAIEIVAGRLGLFGLEGLADGLGERLDTPNESRRTAVERHRTIRNAFDWAHGNLTGVEKSILRRLGVFVGVFSLDAALAVACDGELDSAAATEGISGLVRKSMLQSDLSGGTALYSLLNGTRLYALDRLAGAGEEHQIRGRHMAYHLSLLEHAADH